MPLAQVLQAGLPQRGRAGQGVLPPGPSWRCLEAVSTPILAVLCRPEGQLSSFSRFPLSHLAGGLWSAGTQKAASDGCSACDPSLKWTFFPQIVDEARQHSAGHKEELRQCIVLQGKGGNGTMPVVCSQLPCEHQPWGFADYSRKMWCPARSSNLPGGDNHVPAVPAEQ